MRKGSIKRVGCGSASVGDQVLQIREPAVYHVRCGNCACTGGWLHEPKPFIVEEPEGSVSSVVDPRYGYRAADRPAKLILAIFGFWDVAVEIEICIEQIVAEILPQVSMDAVGSGLYRCIDYAPCRVTEFRTVVAALDFEFLDCVRRGNDGRVSVQRSPAIHLDVVVDPIESEVILPEIDTVYGKVGTRCTSGVARRSSYRCC